MTKKVSDMTQEEVEAVRAYRKAYRAKRKQQQKDNPPPPKDPEKVAAEKARQGAYYAKNREKMLAKSAARYKRTQAAMSEAELEEQRAVWRERERMKRDTRSEADWEEFRAYQRAQYANDADTIRAKRKRANLTPEALETRRLKDKAYQESLSPERKEKVKAIARAEYSANPPNEEEKEMKRVRTRQSNRTPDGRYRQMKAAAKKKGREVSLTLDEYTSLIEQPCIYCNEEMGKPSVAGIGLDRIDNKQGYHLDNVNPCCTACNVIRGYLLTVEETHVAIQAVLGLRRRKAQETQAPDPIQEPAIIHEAPPT